MDRDLQDSLMAWTGGGPVEEERLAALLERLRTDATFRVAFTEEIRVLGMLKAAQSPEPRWLDLADELGAPIDAPVADHAFADAVMDKIVVPPRGLLTRLAPTLALAAAVTLLAGAIAWRMMRPSPSINPTPVAASATPAPVLAVISQAGAAQGFTCDGKELHEGDPVLPGRLRLKSGTATLSFFNGATMYLEGESDLDLVSMEKVACRVGRLHVRAEGGAQGFTVTGPRVAVVDLGTEFGFNVGSDGRSAVHVFEGQVEASLLTPEGYTLRSELLDKDQSATALAGAGRLERDTLSAGDFAAAHPLPVRPLPLKSEYPTSVLAAKPWGYWRFEGIENGLAQNEVAGGFPLRISGALTLGDEGTENHALRFPSASDAYAIMDGTWQPESGQDYAIEAWVMPESVRLSALVSLIADEPLEKPEKHYFLLQLMDRSQRWLHPNGSIRFLHRSPPGGSGGVNAFADHPYIPGRWHHLVAQKVGTRLELYVNGRLAGEALADADSAAGAYRLLLGRLKQSQRVRLADARPFVGRLDEVALYDHALTPAEISRHAALGSITPDAPH